MNEKLKNLNKKQIEKCLITLEMLTFETPKIYIGLSIVLPWSNLTKNKLLGKFHQVGLSLLGIKVWCQLWKELLLEFLQKPGKRMDAHLGKIAAAPFFDIVGFFIKQF